MARNAGSKPGRLAARHQERSEGEPVERVVSPRYALQTMCNNKEIITFSQSSGPVAVSHVPLVTPSPSSRVTLLSKLCPVGLDLDSPVYLPISHPPGSPSLINHKGKTEHSREAQRGEDVNPPADGKRSHVSHGSQYVGEGDD